MKTMKPDSLHFVRWAFSSLLLLSVAACSSKERNDLILIDVDLTEVPTTQSMEMAVLSASNSALLLQQTVPTPTLAGGIAKIGLTQPAGLTGSISVYVTAKDASGVVLGEGASEAAVLVTSGQNVGPISVKVRSSSGDLPDGGPPGPETPDGSTPDSLGSETGTPSDGQSPSPDAGPDGGRDGQPLLPEAGGGADAADAPPDALSPADVLPPTDAVPTDTVLPPRDAPEDADVGSGDGPVDAAPQEAGTILSTMNACTKYVHYPDSPATCASGSMQEDIMINTVAITPDGKYVVTAGNNSWVKLWKVVDTGLEDTQMVIVGDDYSLTAAISPDGNVLSVVNPGGNVVLYDMQSLIQGAAREIGKLDVTKLAAKTYRYTTNSTFTTDGKQLVVNYPTNSSLSDDKTIIAVWDLTTFTLLREFDFDYPTWPLGVARAASTGPLWVVVGVTESVADDAGSHKQSTVTLVDASGYSTARPSFVADGDVYRATFTADLRTLAIGTAEGEVSLWDLTNMGNIQRYGSPLVAGGTDDTVYGLAYTPDDRFLAVGSWIWGGASTLRVIEPQSRAVYKRSIEFEPRTFSFAADGTSWAYGLGGCGFFYYCQN